MELIQNTLRRFVDSGEIAGCAVRVMRNDEVLCEDSFGYADIEKKMKMSEVDNKVKLLRQIRRQVRETRNNMSMPSHAQSPHSCLNVCDPVDCSLPGSSVHGIFSGKNTGKYCHALLQGTFLT